MGQAILNDDILNVTACAHKFKIEFSLHNERNKTK